MGFSIGHRTGIIFSTGLGTYTPPPSGVDFDGIYTDGVKIFRKVVRAGLFCLDKALTPLGFAGTEDTDWVNVKQVIY